MSTIGSQQLVESTVETIELADVTWSPGASSGDRELLEDLRRGDESAFVRLVEYHHAAMLRLAMSYVGDRAVAEEVVQDTWLGILRGLDGFEGRSSLKTWMFHILANQAKTRAQREARTIAFSALAPADADGDEPAVAPECFLPADHPYWPGHWASPLQPWGDVPEARILSQETRERLDRAIEALPPAQHQVITLRDIEGWTTEEICNLLQISETNQRVLLHRARSKVRQALEQYFQAE
jgi:RNA polymerase sigma-70 factor (ECF subfamily)